MVLIALAAKKAILINQFALAWRAAGRSLIDSAIEGARLRFRPVMTTSFAFARLPLVIAAGLGDATRRAVGTLVFFGMLVAAVVGVCVIPMLYVVFQWMREKAGWRPGQGTTHAARKGVGTGTA